jgi:hypothetical protein
MFSCAGALIDSTGVRQLKYLALKDNWTCGHPRERYNGRARCMFDTLLRRRKSQVKEGPSTGFVVAVTGWNDGEGLQFEPSSASLI